MDTEAIESTLSSDGKTSVGPEDVKHDEKTDELVTSLESSVDKAYSTIQGSTLTGLNKIQGMVAEKLPELQKQWNEVKLPQLSDVNELTKNLKLDDYVKKEDLENLKQRSAEFMNKAGENTNKALDNLDNDLEKIENFTINYAQQIGGTLGSFIKSQINATSTDDSTKNKETNTSKSNNSWNWSGWGKQLTELISGDSPETILNQEKKTELLFSLPKNISPGTRAESEIHELQSDPSIYLKAVKDGQFKDYKLTDEDKIESKELLNNESLHLISVYKKIIKINKPKENEGETEEKNDDNNDDGVSKESKDDKITDEEFWKVYFGKKEQIIQDEKKRRELLEKSKNVEENEDEDFNWDE